MTDTAAATNAPAPLTPAQQALAAAMKALEEAKALVAAEEAAAKRSAKIDRINARVDRRIAALQPQIDALEAQLRQLELSKALIARRRIDKVEAQPQAPQATTTPRTTTTPGGSKAQPWKTSVPYQFWVAYQRQFRIAAHTQKVLTETCKKYGVDQTVPSVANLTKVRDLLNGKSPAPLVRGPPTAGGPGSGRHCGP
jgi:hypothetical protein